MLRCRGGRDDLLEEIPTVIVDPLPPGQDQVGG
jgi:hypothetical protein